MSDINEALGIKDVPEAKNAPMNHVNVTGTNGTLRKVVNALHEIITLGCGGTMIGCGIGGNWTEAICPCAIAAGVYLCSKVFLYRK